MNDEPVKLRVKFTPLEWQAEVTKKSSKSRFFTLVVHRNGGKTWLAVKSCLERILKCPYPRAKAAYIAPEKNQAKKIVWDIFKELLSPWPSEFYRLKETELDPQVILFPDTEQERTIYIVGAKDPDAVRGQRFDTVVMDEVADMPRDFFELIIQPCLRKDIDYSPYSKDYRSSVLFIGTPRGKDNFYTYYLRGVEGKNYKKGWGSALYTVEDTGVYSKQEIEELKNVDNEGAFDQEYMCSFYPRTKGSFFGRQINLLKQQKRLVFTLPEDVILLSGWDIGYDGTVAWLMYYDNNVPVVYDVMELSGQDINDSVMRFRELYKGKKLGLCYLPHDASMRLPDNKDRTKEGIFKGYGLLTKVIKRTSSKASAIIGTASFINSVKLYADVEERFSDLINYKESIDKRTGIGTGTPIHNVYSHSADAFITLAMGASPTDTNRWIVFDGDKSNKSSVGTYDPNWMAPLLHEYNL